MTGRQRVLHLGAMPVNFYQKIDNFKQLVHYVYGQVVASGCDFLVFEIKQVLDTERKRMKNYGLVRVAAAVPKLKVGNVPYNAAEIRKLAREAFNKEGASVVIFPELALTGYTCGDLFRQTCLIEKAREALVELAGNLNTLGDKLAIVGLPLDVDGKLFNVAAVLGGKTIIGFVPKTNLPNYGEFYERRWFTSARDLRSKEVLIDGKSVPIGTDLLFRSKSESNLVLAIEICEDLWMPITPSSFAALAGATLVVNLSASNALVGKTEFRRQLVAMQSAKAVCGYAYVSCGPHESTTDTVFDGHAIVAENGIILRESDRFKRDNQIICADLDFEQLCSDRQRTNSFNDAGAELGGRAYRTIEIEVAGSGQNKKTEKLRRPLLPTPFIPVDLDKRQETCREIFSIQTAGLAKRLEQTGIERVVMGLSGGLDSALAFLVAIKTYRLLGRPLEDIYALSLPGFGTGSRTQENARRLAAAARTSFQEIDIIPAAQQEFRKIGHSGVERQDVTFENVQARERTKTLLNLANRLGSALVLGTGDLSEIALGWCTFNADHISHYHVNAGIPKTLIQYVVGGAIGQNELLDLADVLRDILDTPISPELVCDTPGSISQKTEGIIGPYALHDFFLYHFVRWGSSPRKILFLAEHAFRGIYGPEEIKRWLVVFIQRFFGNQWKRSVMPDGPKVGSVALSPRSDWRMPSDADVELWLSELA